MDNIIKFPESKIIRFGQEPISAESVEDKVNILKEHHVNETLSVIMPMLFTSLDSAGFSFDPDGIDNTIKDGALVLESLRSIMYKYYEIPHPFQLIADNLFIEDPEFGENAYKLADEINIKIKQVEEEENG